LLLAAVVVEEMMVVEVAVVEWLFIKIIQFQDLNQLQSEQEEQEDLVLDHLLHLVYQDLIHHSEEL
jgi:hypothetical protein